MEPIAETKRKKVKKGINPKVKFWEKGTPFNRDRILKVLDKKTVSSFDLAIAIDGATNYLVLGSEEISKDTHESLDAIAQEIIKLDFFDFYSKNNTQIYLSKKNSLILDAGDGKQKAKICFRDASLFNKYVLPLFTS